VTEATTAAVRPARNDALDLLRGAVMIVMALDHARDFFSNHGGDPAQNLAGVGGVLFFTRWVTHFCAPVFLLLAGAGAALGLARGKSPRDLARFLVTRGLWLLLVEVTLVRSGWMFELAFHIVVFQVIWAIGISMILLAPLVALPAPVVGALGVAIVAGHDLLDRIHAADLGRWSGLWHVLHERGLIISSPSHVLNVIYPIIPWPGVMMVGFGLGAVLARPAAERRRWLLRAGAGATVLFVALRAMNGYGDPRPWTAGASPLATVMSFLACSKYPPSLCYLLMTLGPALVFLAAADRFLEGGTPRWAAPVVTFGRVPFLFYVLHVPLIHGGAVAVGALRGGAADASAMAHKLFLPDAVVARVGFSLPVVYLAWALAILVLYPVCRWFASVKARSRAAWLGYL
jgi:uncharacterized membrane protein